MGNYFVEDDMPEYDDSVPKAPRVRKRISFNFDKTKLIIIGAVILVVLVIIALSNKKTVKNTYLALEEKMVSKAKDYAKTRSLDSTKELYFDVKKLNVELPNNCNMLSGVIYKNGQYTPYLMCDSYESSVIEKNGVSLRGNSVLLIAKGGNYYEMGHNESGDVQISGNVDTNTEGVYNVYYIPNSSNSYGIRKVIVVDNPTVQDNFPIINIQDESLTLELRENYSSSVMAIDKKDGNITNKIIETSDVNIDEVGEYKKVYSVTNSLGYTTMALQKIIVINSVSTSIITKLSDDNMTNNSVHISVEVLGNTYNHLVLPNGDEIKDTKYDYEVTENGKYEFIAYNNDGTSVSKIVKVNNIDKSVPAGTCSVVAYYNKTEFTVTVSSFNRVIGYNYHVNGHDSGYITSAYYSSSIAATTNLSVSIKDYIGNVGTIKCNVTEKKSSLEPYGYTKKINTGARLHIPIAQALANKGHTINDLNKCIADRVRENGPYTRYGVTAAAYGLIECTSTMTGYFLPYNHTSGRVDIDTNDNNRDYCTYNSDICGKLGVSSRWGSPGGSCNSTECWHGLNCASFVRWSMCNGGMNLCKGGHNGAYSMASEKFFPGSDAVSIFGTKVTYKWGNDLTKYSAQQLVRMIKPGDVIAHVKATGESSSQHTYVVVGITNDYILTANDGYYMEKRYYSNMLDGSYAYRILFLDNYYANKANRNNLYG